MPSTRKNCVRLPFVFGHFWLMAKIEAAIVLCLIIHILVAIDIKVKFHKALLPNEKMKMRQARCILFYGIPKLTREDNSDIFFFSFPLDSLRSVYHGFSEQSYKHQNKISPAPYNTRTLQHPHLTTPAPHNTQPGQLTGAAIRYKWMNPRAQIDDSSSSTTSSVNQGIKPETALRSLRSPLRWREFEDKVLIERGALLGHID